MPLQPPPGYVDLILFSQADPFYLEIPVNIVMSICSSPLKYLKYLGWCVLGVIGDLQDQDGVGIALDGALLDQGVYRYAVPGGDTLAHAVDLEVIKQRTHVTTNTQARQAFRDKLLQRDGCCVWTGGVGTGMHIIPHARGDEWLQCIIANRPHSENLSSLRIDHIRNGFLAASDIHREYFDPRLVVVLKTPNRILGTTDILIRHQRFIETDVSYPRSSRYTLQWLVTPERMSYQNRAPHNNDATFKDQRLPKPAELLLHYNYGGAAIKHWGKNTDVLRNRPGIPRPPTPILAPMEPPTVKHDHHSRIRKRTGALGEGEPQGERKRGRGAGRKQRKGAGRQGNAGGNTSERIAVGSQAKDKWDEDDVMLFFWGNSKAARERHAQKDQEHRGYVEDWRAVSTGSSMTV